MPYSLDALIFVLLVSGIPLLWLARFWRQTTFTLVQMGLFCLAMLLVRLLWRARLPARFPFPHGQGVVLICNHRSSIDPFFFQMCMKWRGNWMVAKEYFSNPLLGWFLRQTGSIPTNRGGVDTASTKAVIRVAAEGGVVGMFPEGRINMTDQLMLPVRPGAVLVALKARVPILPCYLEGVPYGGTAWSPLLMPARVRLRFGQPIDLSSYYGRENETGLVQELMLRCLRDIARLAGQDDFQPQLAGRHWKPTEQEVREHVVANRERIRSNGR